MARKLLNTRKGISETLNTLPKPSTSNIAYVNGNKNLFENFLDPDSNLDHQ